MGEWVYRSTFFLASALVRSEWSGSSTGCFNPGERAPVTHCIGSWVDSITGLDDVEKRQFLALPGSNSDILVVQPVTSRNTDYAIPAPFK
jgi:hypothetical protein